MAPRPRASRPGKEVSRTRFVRYADAFAKALAWTRARLPGWPRLVVPFGRPFGFLRPAHLLGTNRMRFVRTLSLVRHLMEKALANESVWTETRQHSIEWIQGERPMPTPSILAAMVRSILRGAAAFEDASRPPRRKSRRR